jgi:hypothetical protein
MYENTRARVIHCFLVFGYPGETLALVVHILLTNFLNDVLSKLRGLRAEMSNFRLK